MEKVKVLLGKNSYDIIIGKNILEQIADYVKSYDKVLIISNDTVGPIYKERLSSVLQKIIPNIYYYEIKDGEEYKVIDTVLPIYDYMLENNFDRSSLVVSLGGGVVCDLSGYVAATFMRGLDFIQVPTSLLAQVDASIGGKVAVNHSKGKNLIGCFYQPKLVFIDTETLDTLPQREIKTGLAEIIKHSVIWDEEYFRFLINNSKEILELEKDIVIKMIKRSCEIKAEIVSQDETEKGVRKLLNYGHTYGHVVESLTKYKVYRHGEAVVCGMTFAAHLAKELGMVDEKFINRQNEIFEKFEMEYSIPKYDYNIFQEILKHDKKVKKGKIVFVLPEKIGKAEGVEVEEEIIKKVYESIEAKNVKAVIDIGTNTVRLFVAEVKDDKIIKKYEKFMEITRLGQDVDKNKFFLEEAIERNIETLKKYKKYAQEYGVKEIKAVATSAARDAYNRDVFLDRAYKETGIKIDVITGDEEGSNAFKGVMTDKYENDVLVVDIGGGSTEFIYGNDKKIKYIKSLDIGAVRIKEKFFSDEDYKNNYEKASIWIKDRLDEIKELKEKTFLLVGVAGTITTQVSVAKEMKEHNSDFIHGYRLNLREIENNLSKFDSMDIENRKKIIGLNPKRADVITAGTFLLKNILEYFGKQDMIVSENDILEGLMINNEHYFY